MPIARFQMPDGRIGRFQVPDGTSPEQAQSSIEQFLGATSQQPKQTEQRGVGRTALDQAEQGATFGFGDEIMDAIGSLGAAAYMKAFRPDLLGENGLGDLYSEARGMSKERLGAQMEQHPVISLTSQLAGGLGMGTAAMVPKALFGTAETASLAGRAINAIPEAGASINNWVRSGNAVRKAAKAAAVGVPSAALYGAGAADDGKRMEGAAEMAPYGLLPSAIPLGGAALKKTANAVIPTIEEGMRPVVELAQKYKIPVAVSQVTNSNAIKNAQKVSSQLPLSGESAFKERQMKAFNNALIKTTGGNGNKFTPELMDNLFTKVGREFDDFGRGKIVNLNDNFAKSTEDILLDLKQVAPEAVNPALERIKLIFSTADKSGQITGEKLGALRKETNRLARKASNPDVAGALHDIENALIESITVNDKAAAESFAKTKQKYKNLLVLEPLTAKSKGGNISPTELKTRVAKIYGRSFVRGNSGEIGDLARIGNELLPELGGSDTTQKLIYAGGALNPAMVAMNAGKIAATLGGNRLAQEMINRNPSVISAAMKKSRMASPSSPVKITIRPSDKLK